MEPLAADEWGDKEYAAFGLLLGLPAAKVPRAGSGHDFDPLKFPIIGLLVRHPDLAAAFLTFNTYLLQRAELAPRLRELVILTVALRHRAAFEWGQHVKMAKASGVTDEEIAKISLGHEAFDGDDGLVIGATTELLDAHHLSGDTWNDLAARLGTHAAMEVIFVVGAYITTGMAFGTWGLAAAAGSAPLPDTAPPAR